MGTVGRGSGQPSSATLRCRRGHSQTGQAGEEHSRKLPVDQLPSRCASRATTTKVGGKRNGGFRSGGGVCGRSFKSSLLPCVSRIYRNLHHRPSLSITGLLGITIVTQRPHAVFEPAMLFCELPNEALPCRRYQCATAYASDRQQTLRSHLDILAGYEMSDSDRPPYWPVCKD